MIDVVQPCIAAPAHSHADQGASETAARARLREFLEEYYALVWRMVRRFGVAPSRVDEAVSRVVDVLVRRLEEVEPERERAFVVQVCLRVASEFRRADAVRARREAPVPVERLMSDAPSPEEALAQKQARAQLDQALDALEPELRAVFVLYELEQWTVPQIADSLGLARGTAASRLRRARADFADVATRLRHRLHGVSR